MMMTTTATTSTAAVATHDDELRRMRRDLRGLVVLEILQVTFAVGALVAVVVHQAMTTHEPRHALVLAFVVSLALAYLVHAFRIRMGQELLRKDLHAMLVVTHQHDQHEQQWHPYRSTAPTAPTPTPTSFRQRHLWLLAQMLFVAVTLTGAAIAVHGGFIP